MHCFACNTELVIAAGERIGFRDACDHCGQDLHACRSCSYFDEGAYNECHESNAERVLDKDRANRCDYFSPGERAGGDGSERTSSLASLENLFKK